MSTDAAACPPIRVDAARTPARVRQLLAAGNRVLICSRASAEGGVDARNASVGGVYTAADELAIEYGLDVRHLLPSPETLRARVATSAVRRASRASDGGNVRNWSYVYDDAADQGVAILIQYGTGATLDAEYQQPAIETAARTVAEWRPVVVYAHEVRAWGRAGFPLLPLVRELWKTGEALGEPVFVGDQALHLQPMSEEVERHLFAGGMDGAAEAQRTYTRTRRGMYAKTAKGEVTSPFAYGASPTVPDGLSRCRVRGEFEDPDKTVAHWDSPSHFPPNVIRGLPTVLDPQTGKLADQVELRRFFWRHYLTPGWDHLAMASYLVAHGISSSRLREMRRDSGATYRLRLGTRHAREDARRICNRIFNQREFHLTGRWIVKIDGRRTRDVFVAPPDGVPIATVEQVRRVEEAKAVLAGMRRRPRVRTFSGIIVGTATGICLLTPAKDLRPTAESITPRDSAESRSPELEQRVRFCYQRIDDQCAGAKRSSKSPGSRRRSPEVPLSHEAIAEAIVRALASLPNLSLIASVMDLAAIPVAEAKVEACEINLIDASTARAAAYAHVQKPELHGTGLAAAQEALDKAERVLRDARTAHDAAVAALRTLTHPEPSGLPVSALFRVVESLRDPFDLRFRDVWRSAIHNFKVRSCRRRESRHRRVEIVTFSFIIRLVDDEGRVWDVPASGEERTQRDCANPFDQVVGVLDQMRRGVPAAEATFPYGSRRLYPYLRSALGFDPHEPCIILNVTDPRLLRYGMATRFPPTRCPIESRPVTNPGEIPCLVDPPLSPRRRKILATSLGEPSSLLEDLNALYGRTDMRAGFWIHPRSGALSRAIAAARAGTLTADQLPRKRLTPDGYPIFDVSATCVRLTACPHCRSRQRHLLRIREPRGMICRRCRRDEIGRRWAKSYDQYIDEY